MQRNAKIITRLTALWALSEAGLGGVLHAIQFPFTGLLVGGFAIVLISLIAYFSDHKWDTIFRSLLVVLIIKLAVSPHSPPTSYLAVSFQAFMAALIFNKNIKATNYQIDTYKKKIYVYGIALTSEEKDEVVDKAKEILDVEDVIASIILVDDLRIQKD